jgi:sodium/potassium-transporting ATPase subunit alpha
LPGRNDPVYLQATTACLAAIVVMQVVHVFLCRDARASIVAYGLSSNPMILWGIGVEVGLLLAIVYTPWGNMIFGTAPLGLGPWLFLVPFTAAMLMLEEGRKMVVRRKRILHGLPAVP